MKAKEPLAGRRWSFKAQRGIPAIRAIAGDTVFVNEREDGAVEVSLVRRLLLVDVRDVVDEYLSDGLLFVPHPDQATVSEFLDAADPTRPVPRRKSLGKAQERAKAKPLLERRGLALYAGGAT